MSETFSEARTAIRKLKVLLRDADEDTRWSFGFWVLGLASMFGAVVGEFGWRGAGFCFGLVLWKSADHSFKK